MVYRYLPEHLHATADAAKQYFRDQRGLSNFKVEEQWQPDLDYRPTLATQTQDHYTLCVEVLDQPYSSVLDTTVLDCIRRSLPVKLYVAFPAGVTQTEYKKCIDRARMNGVGALEVGPNGCAIIHEALPLSLAGVRPINPRRFPPKYRSALAQAETTFRAAAPSQGCFLVQQEVEHLSRKVAAKTRQKGYWRALSPGEKYPRITDRTAWARVMEALIGFLDFSRCPAPDRALLNRVAGMTSHRNDGGHKPTSNAALLRRDTEAKTRFESAIDTLADLIHQSGHLRV